MDPYSWLRKDEILQADYRAKIRSAVRKLHTWDDEYGCTADGFGFDYWYYQMKFIVRMRSRKRVSRYMENVERARKSYKKYMQDIFGDDDDE